MTRAYVCTGYKTDLKSGQYSTATKFDVILDVDGYDAMLTLTDDRTQMQYTINIREMYIDMILGMRTEAYDV